MKKMIMLVLFVLCFPLNVESNTKVVRIGLAINFRDLNFASCNPFGTSFQEGVLLALRDYHKLLCKHDLKVELEYFDYGSGGLKILKVVEDAAKSDIIGLIGYPCSTDAFLAAPVHEELKLPMLTPCASSVRLASFSEYVHLSSFSNEYTAQNLAKLARKILKAETVTTVVALDCAYCTDLANNFKRYFEKVGGTVHEVEILLSEKNINEVVSNVTKYKNDAIFVPNPGILSAQIIRELSLYYNGEMDFLGADSWGNEGSHFNKIIGDVNLRGYAISHWHPDLPDKSSRIFRGKYLKLYGREPNDTSVLAYDGMSIILNAIIYDKAYTRNDLEKALKSLKHFTGVTGNFSYSGHGFPKKTQILLRLNKNKFSIIKKLEP